MQKKLRPCVESSNHHLQRKENVYGTCRERKQGGESYGTHAAQRGREATFTTHGPLAALHDTHLMRLAIWFDHFRSLAGSPTCLVVRRRRLVVRSLYYSPLLHKRYSKLLHLSTLTKARACAFTPMKVHTHAVFSWVTEPTNLDVSELTIHLVCPHISCVGNLVTRQGSIATQY
jgi:hypothetical protein